MVAQRLFSPEAFLFYFQPVECTSIYRVFRGDARTKRPLSPGLRLSVRSHCFPRLISNTNTTTSYIKRITIFYSRDFFCFFFLFQISRTATPLYVTSWCFMKIKCFIKNPDVKVFIIYRTNTRGLSDLSY